jgi:hypothetical protein
MYWNDAARGGKDLAGERALIYEQFKNTGTVKGVTNIKDPAATGRGSSRGG